MIRVGASQKRGFEKPWHATCASFCNNFYQSISVMLGTDNSGRNESCALYKIDAQRGPVGFFVLPGLNAAQHAMTYS